MIPQARQFFNQQFSIDSYQQFLNDLDQEFNYKIPFRVAESPVFVGKEFGEKLFKAANEIIDVIVRPGFKTKMQGALPENLRVPNETANTLFIALDFAVCTENGVRVPRLIEMQGFPSLFGYQDFLGNKFKEHYRIPDNLHFHFGLNSTEYWQRIRQAIVGKHNPENVILLEINPLKQNTAIDFLITQKHLGIAPVHIGDIIIRNKKLFYKKNGVEIPVHRIYNRVIFDELLAQKDLKTNFHLTEDVEVEWAGHPNWFFYISKYTMPFVQSDAVPECKFLNEYKSWPDNLGDYVLKPLFSFSGSGVIFHVTKSDLDSIPAADRKNFMLQRKVHYEPVIQAPDGLVKTEIRLLFLWNEGESRPQLITNLARLSRGEMIGVKFNKDKTWVGGSVCFFE
ncbi:MAG TPA: hypothetical protein PLM56_07530 [Cyclobacteriaceae bacterium]|jgi:hypothetical protein|nr:hypothetical protein [Cytophagales bacterium]HMR56755.1 hypothetical protein [Cyclobacteriaceae bacterium]HRE67560.1 hypothetical protein [Cyclobacteriaceae bacterium]HRF33333.1 hypothetical protein [Cyclobacteriaceae bacterium]